MAARRNVLDPALRRRLGLTAFRVACQACRRTLDFGDITEVVGDIDRLLSTNASGGVLRLNCTSPQKLWIIFTSRDGGYLTPGNTSAESLADNRKIKYSPAVIPVGGGTAKFLDGILGSFSIPFTMEYEFPAGETSARFDMGFGIVGGKAPDGTYRYLEGVYTDVVTVAFFPAF